jgi:hypothetical protein
LATATVQTPPPAKLPFFKRCLHVRAPWFGKWISSDLLIISVRNENIQGYRAMGWSVEVQ